MRAIIIRGKKFGTLNGVILPNTKIREIVNKHLKKGKAKILIDNENTLMYKLIK